MKPDIQAAGRSTVASLFSSRAQSQPRSVAMTFENVSFTYEELDIRSTRLANFLRESGLICGDRVGAYLRNCSQYLELELAAAKLGVIVAALNWRLGDRELKHCVELVEPKLIVTQVESRKNLSAINAGHIPILQTGDEYETALSKTSGTPPNVLVEPESGLIILYTSGTTGLPKGALISHRAMIARAAAFTSDLALPNTADFVAWAPLFHMASTDHALATLMRGGTVHIVDGYEPERMIEVLRRNKVGWFVLMPGMVGDFAEKCVENHLIPRGIVACGAMADLVPRSEIVEVTTALNAPYLNTFGSTETGLPPATGNTIPIGVVPKSLSKQQSTFCEVRLVDEEDNEVPCGAPGEITVRGATIFSGYWKADETNAHDFRNGWFHMGDVMRRNIDGTLDYVDRVKYMIKSGGENIYPAEIERILEADVRVESATVVKRSDEKWGEVPAAFIVAHDKDLTAEDLRAMCEAKLSRYKIPKEFIFIADDDLPRSTTGKIQRHLLEERFDTTP